MGSCYATHVQAVMSVVMVSLLEVYKLENFVTNVNFVAFNAKFMHYVVFSMCHLSDDQITYTLSCRN